MNLFLALTDILEILLKKMFKAKFTAYKIKPIKVRYTEASISVEKRVIFLHLPQVYYLLIGICPIH